MPRPATLGVAGAHEEPVRPGLEAGRVAELRKVLPDGQQRLLRRILGEIDVAQDPVRHRVEPATDGDGEAREGLFVTVLGADHEIGVHVHPPWRHLEGTLAEYGSRPAPGDSIIVDAAQPDSTDHCLSAVRT